MMSRLLILVVVLAAMSLAACGKSSEQTARESAAREAALQKALANSIAEEREKDRRMLNAAAQQADERIAREAAAHEVEVASTSAEQARTAPERQRVETFRKYYDKLMKSADDPASAQVRNASLSPKQNGICAEFNAKNKAGSYTGFKRVVVTDNGVTAEEAPTRDTLTQFLVFQIAARDTGCFPDVEKVRILQ